MMNSPLPRRFALLGGPFKPHTLGNAIRHSSSHRFVAAIESDLPDVPSFESWESLLASEEWEAGLFATARQEILEAVRELALCGRPIVFESQVLLPSEFVAEMSLVEAEGTTQIVPFFDWRALPAIRLMQKIVAAGELGPLLEITIERFCNNPGGQERGVLQEVVDGTSLLMDVDIVRMLGGDYSQVTALRSGITETGFLQQTLQFAGPDLPQATCTYRFSDEFDWSCRVVGTSGTATMKTGLRCELDVDGKTKKPADPLETDVNPLSLRILDESFRGEIGSPQWQDLVRFYEVKAAMGRSLQRRRTIDLHFETTSERSQFKTHMATIGCGVILWTMLGIIGLLFAGAVLDPRDRMQRTAEAAGFIVTSADFEEDTEQLTQPGTARIADIASRIGMSDSVVIVAMSDPQLPSELDESRLQRVRDRLAGLGVEDAPARTVLRRLNGDWFARGMQIARVLVFAPVGLYLIVQVLLIVAKPAASPIDRA